MPQSPNILEANNIEGVRPRILTISVRQFSRRGNSRHAGLSRSKCRRHQSVNARRGRVATARDVVNGFTVWSKQHRRHDRPRVVTGSKLPRGVCKSQPANTAWHAGRFKCQTESGKGHHRGRMGIVRQVNVPDGRGCRVFATSRLVHQLQ